MACTERSRRLAGGRKSSDAETRKVRSALQRPHAGAVAGLVICAVLALAAGGCAGESRVVQVDAARFQGAVLDSAQPVLVAFYKDGCPLCLPLDPVMDELSMEYAGRATVARFMIMTAYWTFPAMEIKQKYDIYFVSTVILFNKGVEVKRWAHIYLAGPYRSELDRLVKAPADAVCQK
jgi:thioredoxin 1